MNNPRKTAIVVALLAGALIINLDVLLLHPSTQLPGSPAEAAFSLLHIWWPAASLSHADEPVIHSFIGAPYLANHLTNMPMLQSVMFTALKNLGPVLAFNILLVFSQLVSHLMLVWFFYRKHIPILWAALAATLFILSPWYSAVIARGDLISASWWLPPLAFIVWDFWSEKPNYGRAICVVLTLYAAILSGVQNLLWIVSLWLPYVIWQSWRQFRRENIWGAVEREQLTVIGLAFLVLLLIYPTPVWARTLLGNEPAYGPATFILSKRSFIGWIIQISPALVAVTTLTIALARPTAHRWNWLALICVHFAIAVSLIPDPLNMAAKAFDLPYYPLSEPDFFFGPTIFALLIYLTQTWAAFWQAGKHQKLSACLWISTLFICLATNPIALRTLPTHEIIVPGFYTDIAAEPEDYIILEYPFGISSVSDGHNLGDAAYLSQYSVWDNKRSTSGLAPFYEPQIFKKVLVTSFLFPESLTVSSRDSAAQALAVAIREWRIGYMIVHQDLVSIQTQAVLQDLALHSQALCPPIQQQGLIIYRAKWHPFGCPTS